MPPYANKTKVPVDRSIAEVRRILLSHGVGEKDVIIVHAGDGDMIEFIYQGFRIRYFVACTEDPQEQRRRWRAIVLIVKAKFELMGVGFAPVEQVFLPEIVAHNGKLLGEMMGAKVRASLDTHGAAKTRGLLEVLEGGD